MPGHHLARTAGLVASSALASLAAQMPPGIYVASDITNNVVRYDCTGRFEAVLDDRTNRPANGAIGLGFGPRGSLYLARGYTNAVHRFNGTTSRFEPFTRGGSMSGPHRFAFDRTGTTLYVASFGSADVQAFDGRTGAHKGVVARNLGTSVGICVDINGDLYITSRSRQVVFKYSRGQLTTWIRGFRFQPEDVLLGPDGLVYVTEGQANPSGCQGRVLRYTKAGTPFGRNGNTSDPTFLHGLANIAGADMQFSHDGLLYVTDYCRDAVLRFDGRSGAYLGEFASHTLTDGPIGIAILDAVTRATPFGTGCRGSGGHSPQLQAAGCLRSGGHVVLDVSRGLGGTRSVLVFGSNRTSIPFLRCVLHVGTILGVSPAFPLTGSGPGEGALRLVLGVPRSAGATRLLAQAFLLDAGAAGGVSATNGVDIAIR